MTFDIVEQSSPVLEKDSPILDLAKEDQSVAKMVVENTYKPRLDIATVEAPPTKNEVVEFQARLENLPQVRNLTNEIDISNPATIHSFGNKAGEVVEQVSNKLLQNTKAIETQEIVGMMVDLTGVMNTFERADFDPDVDALAGKKGFFRKMKAKVQMSLEDLVRKYENLNKDVDSIAQRLKGYTVQIDQANVGLNQMYEANKQAFQQLEMYVVASAIGLQEIQQEISRVSMDSNLSEEEKQFYTRKLEDNYQLLEQRQADLKSVELVCLQMLPTISMMMKANNQLLCKINTSFIVTLPIFKMGIVMAIMSRRQELQNSAINQLEDATNRIYEENARRISQNASNIAKSVNTNVIKIETAEKVQGIILQGIEQVKQVEKDASVQRQQNMQRMGAMIDDMKKKGF